MYVVLSMLVYVCRDHMFGVLLFHILPFVKFVSRGCRGALSFETRVGVGVWSNFPQLTNLQAISLILSLSLPMCSEMNFICYVYLQDETIYDPEH